jgi:hypothetical protein
MHEPGMHGQGRVLIADILAARHAPANPFFTPE